MDVSPAEDDAGRCAAGIDDEVALRARLPQPTMLRIAAGPLGSGRLLRPLFGGHAGTVERRPAPIQLPGPFQPLQQGTMERGPNS